MSILLIKNLKIGDGMVIISRKNKGKFDVLLTEVNGKKFEGHTSKCVLKTMKVVAKNGVVVLDNLEALADYLNKVQVEKKTI